MRTCEQCHGRMRPFVARRTVNGKRVCEGCASAPMTGRARRSAGFKNIAALENPIHERTGGHPEEWYHGSPHDFEHFGDPADHQDPAMEEYTDRYKHWNTLVGNHFTSDHAVAKEFSGGDHTHSDDLPEDYEGPMGHVVHVKLHLKNPKVYDSEHDMDQEVYEHEWEAGNHHDKYMAPPPEDDDEYEEWAEEYGHRHHYAGDSQHKYSKGEPDPNYAYGFHPKATGWLNTHPDKEGIARRYKERLKQAGYDGVVYGNEYEHSFHGKNAKSAIAFEPHQIEITQHHYGEQDCLSEDEAKRRAVHPDQQVLPGLEDVKRKVPERQRPDLSKHWPTTFTPSFTDNIPRYAARGAQRHDTGRLWAPLPQECWDRYHGRHTGAQRRTAAMGDPTDWDTHYDPGMEVHRGMVVKVPYKLYDKLHDPGSVAEAAQELVERTAKRASTGMHWSADLERARDFPTRNVNQGSTVPVILHAQVPAREGIETRPSVLKRNQVFPHDHWEREVPLRKGTGVEVFGISWKPEGEHPHADEQGWVRHDFTAPVRHTAKSWTMKYATYGPVTPGKTAVLGEESARQHAGQQDVYAVRSGNTVVNLCAYHRDVHVGNASAADALGDQLGLSGRERSAESFGEARKGSCAACNRDTGYQLKLLTPRWMQNAEDSRARRRPDKPMRTKPLPTLKQSENIRWASRGDAFYADTGYESGVRFHPDGTPTGRGDHTVPAGAEVHHDENEAWNKAIEHWKNGASDFPRVYVLHNPKHEGGRLTHESEASELDYDHTRHPAIRSDDEEPHEPILYHGTTRSEDDEVPEEIIPSGGSQSFGPGVADPNYAYATPSLKDAWSYAHKRVENGRGGKPTVYRVTPHDPEDVEEDPSYEGDYSRGTMAHDKRSKKGFEVLDEVPMSQRQEHEWSQNPFNDEAEDEDYGEYDHHFGSLKTLAEWDDEDDEDYEPDECEHCGEDKNSEDHAEAHYDWIRNQKWYTDWDEDRTVGAHNNGEIQRGMAISLPKDVHRIVHDEDRPLEERGRALAEHVIKSANDQGHIGRFWTDEDSVARSYATGSRIRPGSKDDNKTPATPVTLHVKFPGYHHIETDPDELEHHGVYSYHIEDNREVPLRHGTPLEAVGVSWAHHKYGDDGTHHWDRDNADWKRHTFKEPIKAMSSKKELPTLKMLAHDATENEALRHCFTGDTRYLTVEGTKTLAETVGTVQRVLTGTRSAVHSGRWVEAMIHEFGEQPVLRVTLKRNKQTKVIRATPEHRWLVRRPDRIVLTQHLRPGHRLAHLRAPLFEGDPDREGIRMGAVFGDGYIARQAGRTYGGITLWGAKRDLAKYFDDVAASEPRTYVTESGVQGLRYQSGMAGYTKQLPELTESLSYLRGWLMGYFAMDGHVSARGQVTLSSASLEVLEHVRDVATLLGIGTYAPTSKLRRGYGAEPTLIHEMGLSAADLSPSFFLRDDQRAAWRLPAQERFGWTVVSVEDHGEVETVYCPRVPETESFVLEDNIHTMNCPFCGAGKIIGRADGSVECEFCHHYFTVQVQPQYPNFPQTINGMPQQIPGMPGQVETPMGDPAMGAGGFPPDPMDPAAGAVPPWADDGGEGFPDDDAEGKQAEEDEEEPPPFAKQSSLPLFRTTAGARLTEDDYVRHLAIRFAPDRDAMIARIREERGTR